MRLALVFLAVVASTTPRLVGEGTISTPADEFGGQLDLDGKTLWFNRSIPRSQLYAIFVSHREDGKPWSAPEVAPWSGTWRDFDATLSPDGQRLWFISDRPAPGDTAHEKQYDAWVLRRTARGWGAPARVGPPIHGDWGVHFASEAANGTLYFTSDRPGGTAYVDVWRARPDGHGGFAAPENLGPKVNAPGQLNLEAVIAPDESFLVLSAAGRPDSKGDSDLYLCRREGDGWGGPVPLAGDVNTSAREYSPRLSAGGKVLTYASERGVPTEERTHPWTYDELTRRIRGTMNGLGNLYEVDLEAVRPR